MKNIQKNEVIWEKGADSTPEATATSTVTTVKAQQGGEHVGSAEGQSTVSSEGKDSALSSEK